MTWETTEWSDASKVEQDTVDGWVAELKSDADITRILSGDTMVIQVTDEYGSRTIYECKVVRLHDLDVSVQEAL